MLCYLERLYPVNFLFPSWQSLACERTFRSTTVSSFHTTGIPSSSNNCSISFMQLGSLGRLGNMIPGDTSFPNSNCDLIKLRGQVLKYHFLSSRSIFLNFFICQGTVLCHTLRIYIYLIVSPPAVKIISLFQFFYTLILIRQKVYKTLLF